MPAYSFIFQWTRGLLLAIVSSAAMNMGVQMSVWVLAVTSFGSIPTSGIVGSYGNSIFNFQSIALLFSSVAAPFYISTSRAQGFQFFHILTDICYFLFLFLLLMIAILMGVTWLFLVSHFSPFTLLFSQHEPWPLPYFELWECPKYEKLLLQPFLLIAG